MYARDIASAGAGAGMDYVTSLTYLKPKDRTDAPYSYI